MENDFKDAWSYEAFIVDFADEIAQRHHDIEDGLDAGILDKDILVEKIKEDFQDCLTDSHKKTIEQIENCSPKEKQYYLPLFARLIVNLLSTSLINNTKKNLLALKEEKRIVTQCDFLSMRDKLSPQDERNRVGFDDIISEANDKLGKNLRDRVLNSHLAQRMDGRSDFILRQLTKAYVANPQQLPDRTIVTLFENYKKRLHKAELAEGSVLYGLEPNDQDPGQLRNVLEKLHSASPPEYRYALLRTICDYLAGMTDRYAEEQYGLLYGISRL